MSDHSAIEWTGDDEFEEFDDDAACTHCGGDGLQEGDRSGWDPPAEAAEHEQLRNTAPHRCT